MEDWSGMLVFGMRLENVEYTIRPSAYALIEDSDSRLALVLTCQGTFLPGGGIEAGEDPEATIVRETLEECGLIIKPRNWTTRAIQFVYSAAERTHFEKRSTFVDARIVGFRSNALEPDHELVWVAVEKAVATLSHQSQSWAVERWKSRIT